MKEKGAVSYPTLHAGSFTAWVEKSSDPPEPLLTRLGELQEEGEGEGNPPLGSQPVDVEYDVPSEVFRSGEMSSGTNGRPLEIRAVLLSLSPATLLALTFATFLSTIAEL